MPNFPREELLRLAGQCVQCVNYDLDRAVFTLECYSCSRYHGDLFEERVQKTAKSGHVVGTCTEN